MTFKPPIHSFEAGEVIFREGDKANGLYIIRSGSVRITKGEMEMVELGTLSKNAFFGEMALVDNKPRSATVTALEPTQCAMINIHEFKKRLDKLEPIMQGIFRVMIERLRDQNEKLAQKK